MRASPTTFPGEGERKSVGLKSVPLVKNVTPLSV
jgi:hypothetical protein